MRPVEQGGVGQRRRCARRRAPRRSRRRRASSDRCRPGPCASRRSAAPSTRGGRRGPRRRSTCRCREATDQRERHPSTRQVVVGDLEQQARLSRRTRRRPGRSAGTPPWRARGRGTRCSAAASVLRVRLARELPVPGEEATTEVGGADAFEVHREERDVGEHVAVAQLIVELDAVEDARAVVQAEDVVGRADRRDRPALSTARCGRRRAARGRRGSGAPSASTRACDSRVEDRAHVRSHRGEVRLPVRAYGIDRARSGDDGRRLGVTVERRDLRAPRRARRCRLNRGAARGSRGAGLRAYGASPPSCHTADHRCRALRRRRGRRRAPSVGSARPRDGRSASVPPRSRSRGSRASRAS